MLSDMETKGKQLTVVRFFDLVCETNSILLRNQKAEKQRTIQVGQKGNMRNTFFLTFIDATKAQDI